MAKEARDQEEAKNLPTDKKLEQLYELIDGIETAMLTTRSKTGALVSRPMQTQARRAGTDLWFMTAATSGKIDELVADPQVNLGYYKDSSREYVSVSGRARVTQDKALIHELYKPDSFALRSTSVLAQHCATAAGAGIAVLPAFIAEQDPRLRRVLPEQANFTRTFWMSVPSETRNLARMKAVWDFLRETVEAQRGILLPD